MSRWPMLLLRNVQWRRSNSLDTSPTIGTILVQFYRIYYWILIDVCFDDQTNNLQQQINEKKRRDDTKEPNQKEEEEEEIHEYEWLNLKYGYIVRNTRKRTMKSLMKSNCTGCISIMVWIRRYRIGIGNEGTFGIGYKIRYRHRSTKTDCNSVSCSITMKTIREKQETRNEKKSPSVLFPVWAVYVYTYSFTPIA